MGSVIRGIVIVIVCALAAGTTARAAVFTEINPQANAGIPAYLEIEVVDPGELHLLVFNAQQFATGYLWQIVPITVQPAKQLLIVHEGNWPQQVGSLVQTVAVDQLHLNGTVGSRRLVLFGEAYPFPEWRAGNTVAPGPENWSQEERETIVDSVAYHLPSSSAASLWGEPLLDLAASPSGAWLPHVPTTGGFGTFVTGTLDDSDRIVGDPLVPLDPGVHNGSLPQSPPASGNPPPPLPEPASAVVLSLAGLLILRRSGGRRAA